MECQVKGITLYYEEYGAGRPIFALHGAPLDHRHMVHEYEPLFAGRKGWRRIYLDLPGMGQTRAADWITTQDQVLEVLLAFIDVVAPGERFAAAGTSYGGYLAQGLAYQRGEQMDGIMINVAPVYEEPGKRRLPQHRVTHEDPAFLAALRPDEQHVVEMMTAQSVEALENLRTYYDPAGAVADEAFLNRLDQHSSFSFPVDSLPKPFDAPALILTGRFDHWCGYADQYDLLGQYPRATYAVLDRGSHVLVLEENTLFQALGKDWLDRVEEYTQDKERAARGPIPG